MKPFEKVNFISSWIKDYVNNMPSKAESLVIGISGGIDSSVSSTLSAMTGLKTIVLSMPIKQKSYQYDLSLKHQEWLINRFKNVEAHMINLDKLFSTFSSSLSNFDNEQYHELEEAMNNPNSPNRAKYETIRKQNLHKMEPIPVCKIPN